jgi:glycine oxidase
VPQLLAVGHYRGGVLLAPLTAQVIRAHVEDGEIPAVARPFAPSRFGPHQICTPADHRKDAMS